MTVRLDPHAVANTIRMARTVRRGAAAMLVEGSKDARVYRNLVDEERCNAVPAGNKRNALEALALLRRSGERGVLAVVDADFTALTGAVAADPDVIATDAHDLEGMLLRSQALSKLLVEYDLAPGILGPDAGLILARAAQPIGYLRFAAEKHRLPLDFKNIDYNLFTQPGPPLSADVSAFLEEVRKKNGAVAVSPGDFERMILDVMSPAHDPWLVACGHDMTAMLAVFLSAHAGRAIPSYTVERQLRLSYEAACFRTTSLYARIGAWEARNAPYRILRAS